MYVNYSVATWLRPARRIGSYSDSAENSRYMPEVGDTAPGFSAVVAGGNTYNDIDTVTLTEILETGPVVLAFYPAAFTSGCTEEMCTFRDNMSAFAEVNAQVYGISVDLPFAQNIWIQEESLNFPMISDWDHGITEAFDVVLPKMYDAVDVAQRSVFVIDTEQTIRYAWIRDGDNPDFGKLVAEVHDAVVAIADE